MHKPRRALPFYRTVQYYHPRLSIGTCWNLVLVTRLLAYKGRRPPSITTSNHVSDSSKSPNHLARVLHHSLIQHNCVRLAASFISSPRSRLLSLYVLPSSRYSRTTARKLGGDPIPLRKTHRKYLLEPAGGQGRRYTARCERTAHRSSVLCIRFTKS
jgi:hypothetical protein